LKMMMQITAVKVLIEHPRHSPPAARSITWA